MKYLILFFSIILIFDKFYSQTNKIEVIDNPIKITPNEVNERLKYGISDELFRQEAIPVCDSITAYKQLEFSEEVIVYKEK